MDLKRIIPSVMLVSVLASAATSPAAASDMVDMDEDEYVEIEATSPGNVETSVVENTDSGTSSSSGQGGSSAELSEQEERYSQIRRDAKDILDSIIENESFRMDLAVAGGGTGWLSNPDASYAYGISNPGMDDVLAASVYNVPVSVMQELYDLVEQAGECLTVQGAVDRNGNAGTPSRVLEAGNSISGLDAETKKESKQAVASENNLVNIEGAITDPASSLVQGNIRNPAGPGTAGYLDQFTYILMDPGQSVPLSITVPGGNSGWNSPLLNAFRTDIIQGGLFTTPIWTDRMDVLSRFATSNVMNDYCTLLYIEDYHLTDYVTGEVTVTDRTSTLRRWKVTDMETGEVLNEIETNDPVYYFQGYEEGYYQVDEYAEVVTSVSSYVSYDYCWYLVDAATKRILYFDELMVSDGNGGRAELSEEISSTMEPTGTSVRIHVNALGEATEAGTGVERIK